MVKTRPFRPMALFAVAALLSACGALGPDTPEPSDVVGGPALVPTVPQGSVLGDGATTVAMLLPLSAGGSASGLAQAFQNAADLALAEVQTDAIRVLVRDDGGDTEVARAAAQGAVQEGAQLILGPVFAPAVTGAAEAARPANVPVIAFSTDASVTGQGVYLLSFLPRQDATRIVAFATERGLTSFGALVPDNGYGLVMEAAFREAIATSGGRVVAVERYAPGEAAAAAQALAGRGAVDAVFIPNGGDDPATAAGALRAAGVASRLLGSGQWDNPAILSAPALAGAWYPSPNPDGYAAFAARYQGRYGVAPPRTASLVYDATLLANGLVAARGPAAFQMASLQTPDGFLGVDGVFRLTADGLSERGLAVFEVGAGGATTVVSPAPTSFTRS